MTRIRTTAPFRHFGRAATVRTLSLLALLAVAPTAAAQLIAVKTIPIADGDQFSFFPSSNFGMAGVSIALPDSIHDPFVNPAKGGLGRIGRSSFFGAPTFFSVSRDAGGGSTLPVGVLARSGPTFAAIAVAIQSITDGRRASSFSLPPPPGILARDIPGDVLGGSGDDSHSNHYGFVMLGRTFAASKLAIGASGSWSELRAIDGVNLLYGDSRGVSQSGGLADVRLGMLKEWAGGQSLEALLLHHRVGMTHRVTYADLWWDPLQRQTIERPRLEQGRERTNTLGLHLQYERPLADSGWRVGARFTANRLDHPNTPNYEIASIPSDRGRSSALNIGIGLARSQGATRVAVDAIYEPIWSHLWAVTDSAIATPSRGTINAGGTTIDNRLRFSNALLRAGFSHDFTLDESSALRLQLGVQARSIYYTLDQHDLTRGSTRGGDESWMEWTRGWGVTLRLPALEFRYLGRLTTGAERPGVAEPNVFAVPDASSIAPFPGPPTGTTTMNNVRVTTHQLSVSLPIR